MKKPKAKKRVNGILFIDGVMPGAELRYCLERIYGHDQCQSAFARLIGVGPRTVRGWIAEEFPVPKVVAQFVMLMVMTAGKPEEMTI